MAARVDWFFGRGLSIGCGLTWTVPNVWRWLNRDEKIDRIARAIRSEMDTPKVDTSELKVFLRFLSDRTTPPWRHQFYTTNWDYLVQREIESLHLQEQPRWLAETQVYHLNGTVEVLAISANRSNFVLETDQGNARISSLEARTAFDKMIWGRLFVVVGMSFECDVDKFLLKVLGGVEDDLPIGESSWIVVNPNQAALAKSAGHIQAVLPRASVICVETSFGKWLGGGLKELQDVGALSA